MPWLFSKPFRKKSPEKVNQIKETLANNYLTRNSAAFERQLKANTTHDARGRLHRIAVPTLVLTGRYDELTPPKMAEALHSEIPGSKLKIFDQGGHGLYWEIPHRFNRAILNFLASLKNS